MQSAQHERSIPRNAHQRKDRTLRFMPPDSIRKARRRAALEVLIAEAGGVTALQDLTGTPKSHFSAITSGRRGVGDALAAKLEDAMNMPPGWMDRDLSGLTARAVRLASLWDAMPDGLEKERAYAVTVTLTSGDLRDQQPTQAPRPAPIRAPRLVK